MIYSPFDFTDSESSIIFGFLVGSFSLIFHLFGLFVPTLFLQMIDKNHNYEHPYRYQDAWNRPPITQKILPRFSLLLGTCMGMVIVLISLLFNSDPDNIQTPFKWYNTSYSVLIVIIVGIIGLSLFYSIRQSQLLVWSLWVLRQVGDDPQFQDIADYYAKEDYINASRFASDRFVWYSHGTEYVRKVISQYPSEYKKSNTYGLLPLSIQFDNRDNLHASSKDDTHMVFILGKIEIEPSTEKYDDNNKNIEIKPHPFVNSKIFPNIKESYILVNKINLGALKKPFPVYETRKILEKSLRYLLNIKFYDEPFIDLIPSIEDGTLKDIFLDINNLDLVEVLGLGSAFRLFSEFKIDISSESEEDISSKIDTIYSKIKDIIEIDTWIKSIITSFVVYHSINKLERFYDDKAIQIGIFIGFVRNKYNQKNLTRYAQSHILYRPTTLSTPIISADEFEEFNNILQGIPNWVEWQIKNRKTIMNYYQAFEYNSEIVDNWLDTRINLLFQLSKFEGSIRDGWKISKYRQLKLIGDQPKIRL
ncbi:MAG: hypothetical protein HeimC2_40230 [Candidatus Heimdallarchaeota archaeon LC_2]|nr:MAG: hypothetical protein HeimC2_40230 [Candidatus Heimdallarchaeota archaeon LC_2]